jgi:hypothetical protein
VVDSSLTSGTPPDLGIPGTILMTWRLLQCGKFVAKKSCRKVFLFMLHSGFENSHILRYSYMRCSECMKHSPTPCCNAWFNG